MINGCFGDLVEAIFEDRAKLCTLQIGPIHVRWKGLGLEAIHCGARGKDIPVGHGAAGLREVCQLAIAKIKVIQGPSNPFGHLPTSIFGVTSWSMSLISVIPFSFVTSQKMSATVEIFLDGVKLTRSLSLFSRQKISSLLGSSSGVKGPVNGMTT